MTAHGGVEAGPITSRRVLTLPHEISASIVAFATVFLTLPPLSMPTWAIFISWAGMFLIGGPGKRNAARMLSATTAGTLFGVIAILLNTWLGGLIGGDAWTRTLVLAVIVFVVNATLLTVGRLPALSLIPGMFFGFASVTATYFGGFGYAPHDLFAAAVSSAAMSALGPLATYLGVRLTTIGPAGPSADGEKAAS